MVHKRMGKTRCSSFPLRPPQTRLSPTLQRTPKVVQDTMHHQQLQRSRQKQCLIDFYSKPSHKKRYREGKQGRQSRILQPTFPSSQTRKPVETRDRPQFFKSVSHGLKIQNGNPRIHTRIAETRGMGYLYRPLGCLPSSSHPSTIKEIPQVPPPREFLPIHQLAVWASHSPKGVHVPGKGGKTIGTKQDIRLHQYLDDWLIRAPSQAESKEHTANLLSLIQSLGFIVDHQKSELVPQQRFKFIGYHFSLDQGLVRPTQDRWAKIQNSFNRISKKSVINARTLMSIIGLLASAEKTVRLGRIHMRPFQWHLKTHWKFPMPLNSPIPWTQTMKQHAEWWLDPQHVLCGEFLHPRDHDVLIFTDASNAGWGAHLDHASAGGLWSHTEQQLHINVLELKAVILALKHFSDQCTKKQVLVASDNTTVVAHINKQGGTHLPELCALMWHLLTWCNKHQILLRARHVPGSLNVIADGLSRRNQIQHTEWSLSPQIFKQIAQLWEHPQIDLFATRLNTKLPTYVSPIPDPQAWAVDALNISWKNIVGYAFPPTALLPRVVQKLLSQSCRLILIAPGWPTKPWFWDLVELSLDHPRQLPPIRSLLKQPLNNQFHTHPESLNLHVWFLGVQSSRTRASLQKWQIELLHLKDSLLEPSMHQNGQFFKDGAPTNRWTSGLPL